MVCIFHNQKNELLLNYYHHFHCNNYYHDDDVDQFDAFLIERSTLCQQIVEGGHGHRRPVHQLPARARR